MGKCHDSIDDSYHSVNPVWQNMVKKNTDSLKHISRTSSKNMFSWKIGLLANKVTGFFSDFLTNGLKSDGQALVIHISRGTCTRGDIVIHITFALAPHISQHLELQTFPTSDISNFRHSQLQTFPTSNEQTKERKKQTRSVTCFFFGSTQWLEPLRAAKRNK